MLWIIEQIPEYVTYLLFIAGFISLIGVMVIDLAITYRVIIISVCMIALMAASWLVGAREINRIFAFKLMEAQNQVLEAEVKAANISAKTEFIYVDKIQKVRDTQVVIQERIRDVAVTVDEKCKISPELIDIHNAATERPK